MGNTISKLTMSILTITANTAYNVDEYQRDINGEIIRTRITTFGIEDIPKRYQMRKPLMDKDVSAKKDEEYIIGRSLTTPEYADKLRIAATKPWTFLMVTVQLTVQGATAKLSNHGDKTGMVFQFNDEDDLIFESPEDKSRCTIQKYNDDITTLKSGGKISQENTWKLWRYKGAQDPMLAFVIVDDEGETLETWVLEQIDPVFAVELGHKMDESIHKIFHGIATEFQTFMAKHGTNGQTMDR